MSIQESIVSGENIILYNGIVLPEETDFRPCMQYILSENQSILLKSKYKGHEDLCTLFLTAFRIVCSKYRYSNETLSCKSIIFTRDSSKTRYNLINETSFDFPAIKTNETTLQTVFNESKEVFFNNHLTGEQLTEFNCSKAVFHALNTESNQTELECTVRLIDEYISIEFKAPADSPYAKAVSNSSNHFIQILNAFIQSPDAIIATVQITDKSEQDKLLEWGFGEYDPSLNQLDCLHHLFERTLASFIYPYLCCTQYESRSLYRIVFTCTS